MEITCYSLSEVNYDEIKYVVMLAEYRQHLVIVKNKSKDLWELPGGKREKGEPLLKAAGRELFEETGATTFELIPYGVYRMNDSYGMNFYVHIEELGPLPDFEIEKIKLCPTLPENLGYGEIYYKMYNEWMEIQEKSKLSKYKLKYPDSKNLYEF